MSEQPFPLLDGYARQLDLEADQIVPLSSSAEVRRIATSRRTRRRVIVVIAVLVVALSFGAAIVWNQDSHRAVPQWAGTATATSETPARSAPSTRARASTTTKPTGTVVTVPGPGIELKSAADVNAVSWLTPSAKTYLIGELASFQQGGAACSLDLNAYRVPDLISGGYSGCGGAEITWGDFSGTWKEIIIDQAVPLCTEVRASGWTSSIPRDFPGGQCLDDTMTVVDYTP